MVNASLNWASIVGIVLAVSGAGLYFLRSFKPALARDYDVFFAAIGLLCGGILFFQGWRLDPILQFGQFLLAGTTVFFAYESVRLRGVATDQARRSSYFDDDYESPSIPNRDFRGNEEDDYDQFEEAQPIRRRFSNSDRDGYDQTDNDFYRPKRPARPAIPEEAASRRSRPQRDSLNPDSVQSRRMARFRNSEAQSDKGSNFGERRSFRQDQRRGSRPTANNQNVRNSRRGRDFNVDDPRSDLKEKTSARRYREPTGAPITNNAEDAAYSSKVRNRSRATSGESTSQSRTSSKTNSSDPDLRSRRSSMGSKPRPRDNSSRFDD